MTGRQKGLTGSALKLIAIGCMLIDHIAWAFVPTFSLPGAVMHTFGRITAPVMCFMLAEGYRHTRNVRRYALRLLIFAAVSYLPFVYFESGSLPTLDTMFTMNMIYTLFCCLLGLWADEHLEGWKKTAAIGLLGAMTLIGDWPVLAMIFTLNFARNRGNWKRIVYVLGVTAGAFAVMLGLEYSAAGMNWYAVLLTALPQMGVLLAVPLLQRYNGEKGKNVGGKWLFYWFYPVHLTVLGILQAVI